MFATDASSTSFATAYVSAEAALIAARYPSKHLTAEVRQIDVFLGDRLVDVMQLAQGETALYMFQVGKEWNYEP